MNINNYQLPDPTWEWASFKLKRDDEYHIHYAFRRAKTG
jgi:hypothetical protein